MRTDGRASLADELDRLDPDITGDHNPEFEREAKERREKEKKWVRSSFGNATLISCSPCYVFPPVNRAGEGPGVNPTSLKRKRVKADDDEDEYNDGEDAAEENDDDEE